RHRLRLPGGGSLVVGGGSVHDRNCGTSGASGRGGPATIGLLEGEGPCRRWLPGVAGSCALRCDYCDLCAGPCAADFGRPTEGRGQDDHSSGAGEQPGALSAAKTRTKGRAASRAAGALRSHDWNQRSQEIARAAKNSPETKTEAKGPDSLPPRRSGEGATPADSR